MPDGHRRSRQGWADAMEDGPPVVAAHTHRLPPLVRAAIVGLVAAMFLMLVATGLLATYVYQQQQYIQGKGVQRDRENAEINQRIKDRFCELLALAPADSPQADYYREQLECPQPGVATDRLPPAIRQRLEPAPAPVTPAAPVGPVPAPPTGSAAVPGVQSPPPGPVPPRTGPGPGGPTPAPLVDLGPVTEPVCDLAGVCL